MMKLYYIIVAEHGFTNRFILDVLYSKLGSKSYD